MEKNHLNWVSKVWAILIKEIKTELRTMYALNAVFLFSFVTLVVVSFSIGGFGVGLHSAFLWIVILFGATSGLGHVFAKEVETHTIDALRLSTGPSEVFLGKFLFNLILVFSLILFVVIFYFILFSMTVGKPLQFFVILLLGGLGLVSATTIIAAIVARAKSKGILLVGLSFPILIPFLIIVINGTKDAMSIAGSDFWDAIKMLLCYSIVTLAGSFLLFDFVWEE